MSKKTKTDPIKEKIEYIKKGREEIKKVQATLKELEAKYDKVFTDWLKELGVTGQVHAVDLIEKIYLLK